MIQYTNIHKKIHATVLVNTTDIQKLNKAQVLFKFNFVDCEAAETELSYIHNRKLCICWQSIAVIHNFRFPVAATGLLIFFFFFFLFSADDCISWEKKKRKERHIGIYSAAGVAYAHRFRAATVEQWSFLSLYDSLRIYLLYDDRFLSFLYSRWKCGWHSVKSYSYARWWLYGGYMKLVFFSRLSRTHHSFILLWWIRPYGVIGELGVWNLNISGYIFFFFFQ